MASEEKIGSPQYVILPEGASRIIGREAQRANIAVGYAVASIIKTTLGPRGMDKMLVSELGDIVVTNDGATILDEMNVEHPVAKIMVDIAKTQDKEVGDGTTTTVILAGELLKNAGTLLDQGVPATSIIKGYNIAFEKAKEILESEAHDVDIDDTETLKKIALVTIGSKNIGGDDARSYIAELAVRAIKQVAQKVDNKIVIDRDLIKIEKKEGGDIMDTEFINGVLVDKEVANANMPKRIEKAKIALIDVALEIEKTEMDARIEITSPDQMKAFLAEEENMLKEMVDKIAKTGANVLFTEKGIDDVAQHYLAKNGIMAVRRVKKSDMEKLAKATGARVVNSLDDLSKDDLGYAGLVEERKIEGEAMVFVEDCKDAKSVTIFVRGGTKQIAEEGERAVNDVIGALASAVELGKYVYGGGATEGFIAQKLREYATDIGGREQLAVQAFADALEVIPKTLAESAGMDSIDVIVQLRSKYKTKEGKGYGVDVINAKIADMSKNGVFEPMKVKLQAFASATAAATSILRIDDVISAKTKAPSSGGAPTPGEEE